MMAWAGARRYRCDVQYLGSVLHGWQSQSAPDTMFTVQDTLELAFRKLSPFGKLSRIVGSSRTDAGVHALHNVCHIDIEWIDKAGRARVPLTPAVLLRSVNFHLNASVYEPVKGHVMVTRVAHVQPEFNARYYSQARQYKYRILYAPPSEAMAVMPFERGRAWILREKLDVAAMQAAAHVLTGKHDFSSFRAARCQALSPVKTLEVFDVQEVPPPPHTTTSAFTLLQGGYREVVITASAPSFLHHMVRNMVGALVDVGVGKLSIEELQRVLEARNRREAPSTAPPDGLYLTCVHLDPVVASLELESAAISSAYSDSRGPVPRWIPAVTQQPAGV